MESVKLYLLHKSSNRSRQTLKQFRANQKGVLYVFLVIIISLFALAFLSFLFATVIQNVQEGFNPLLGASTWATPEHFNTFYLAASLVTNLWTYIFGIIFFGLVYWAYIISQRRGANA